MCCFDCLNEKLKKLTFCDITIMKICIIAFTLLAAKLWPVLLGLEWGWYAAVFFPTYIYLIYRIFFRK